LDGLILPIIGPFLLDSCNPGSGSPNLLEKQGARRGLDFAGMMDWIKEDKERHLMNTNILDNERRNAINLDGGGSVAAVFSLRIY